MPTRTWNVPNISCMHCAHHIKTGLGPVPGVTNVEVDVQRKAVTCEKDGLLPKIDATLAEIACPVEVGIS